MKTRNASLQIAVSAAFCASVAILPMAVSAATYYVAPPPTGDDGNDGTGRSDAGETALSAMLRRGSVLYAIICKKAFVLIAAVCTIWLTAFAADILPHASCAINSPREFVPGDDRYSLSPALEAYGGTERKRSSCCRGASFCRCGLARNRASLLA